MPKINTSLTAGSFRQDHRGGFKSFFANTDGFSFMSNLKETPAYWKQFLYEALATGKQLRAPTYFDIVMGRYEMG